MKLLIADDEYHVIKTIKYLIQLSPLHFDSVLEAGSAREAISILEQEQPEILITDVVMNDATGLDLMNYLNQTDMPVKVIVISGYNNFEYIRAALREGGVDYLLKPIDADQLTAALQKAVDEWQKEDAQRRQTIKHLDMISSMSAVYKETLLQRIMTQPDPDRSYEDLSQVLPDIRQCRNCIVGYFSCAPYLNDTASDTYKVLAEACAAFSRRLEEKNAGLCFPNTDDGREFLLFLYHHTSDVLRLAEEQILAIRQLASLPVSFGLSRPVAFPALASEALSQARMAFYEQDMFSPAPPCLSYSRVAADHLEARQPAQERQLYSAMITGNETLIDDSIEQWRQAVLPSPPLPLRHGMALTERYNQLLGQWRAEIERQYPKLVLSPSQPLSYCQLLDEHFHFSPELLEKKLKFELSQLFGELTSPGSHPQNDIIYQVAYYIRLNYDKPFSQFACAQLFFINKNYMCRKFKNTFHVSMVSYLNQIRIDRARELLENPGIKIKDIANMVGFEDEKYFSRQFHKNTGMSPNEYRSQLSDKGKGQDS